MTGKYLAGSRVRLYKSSRSERKRCGLLSTRDSQLFCTATCQDRQPILSCQSKRSNAKLQNSNLLAQTACRHKHCNQHHPPAALWLFMTPVVGLHSVQHLVRDNHPTQGSGFGLMLGLALSFLPCPPMSGPAILSGRKLTMRNMKQLWNCSVAGCVRL